MNDKIYLDFFNGLVFRCPFCDVGGVTPSPMHAEGGRIYGRAPEITACPHLLAYGNFTPAHSQGGLDLFPRVAAIANNPPAGVPVVAQRVHGQTFAFFSEDPERIVEAARALPEIPASQSIGCPHCSKQYPLPLWRDRAEDSSDPLDSDFCEHVMNWREMQSGIDRLGLDPNLLVRSCGDHRVRGENVLWATHARNALPNEIAITLRSAWNFDAESGETLSDGEEGIYHVFAFVPDSGHVSRLNEFLAAEIAKFPPIENSNPLPPKQPPKPWWRFW